MILRQAGEIARLCCTWCRQANIAEMVKIEKPLPPRLLLSVPCSAAFLVCFGVACPSDRPHAPSSESSIDSLLGIAPCIDILAILALGRMECYKPALHQVSTSVTSCTLPASKSWRCVLLHEDALHDSTFLSGVCPLESSSSSRQNTSHPKHLLRLIFCCEGVWLRLQHDGTCTRRDDAHPKRHLEQDRGLSTP